MCRFEYKKFDACGDYGIEVYDFCDQALWKAGVHGVLQVCVPEILDRSLEWSGPEDDEPPQVVTFIGYEGFCALCVDKYQLPATIPTRSYSDRELNYWNQSSAFDPHSLAPYILTPGFWARIPDLLGIVDQFEGSRMEQGPYIMFPKLLGQLTWSELRNSMPFTSNGVVEDECHLDLEEILERLDVSRGISNWDKECILKAMQAGINLRALYEILFKPRGMSYGDFDATTECLRAAAIQVLAKMAEDLQEREPQRESEVSDISTLTSLATTPELSDFDDVPLPTQSTTPGKAAQKPKPQQHDKPEDTRKSGTSRKGKHAQASKLAQTAIVAQCTPERPSSSRSMKPSKELSKKVISTYEAEKSRRRVLLRHLRDHDTLDDCVTATQSTDEAIVSPTPAPKSSAAKPAKKKKKSVFLMPVDPNERSRKIAEQERTIDQMRQRKPAIVGSGSGSTAQPLLGGGLPSVVEQTPGVATVGVRSAGNATNDESAGTSPGNGAWTMRGPAAEDSDPRTHPAYGYESSPPYQGANFEFGNAFESQWPRGAQLPQSTQNAAAIQGFLQQEYFNNTILPALSPETVQGLAQSTGHPFFQAAAVVSQPAFPTPGGSQQLAYGLPQLPQTPTRFSQFGLPQPPQTPTQPLQFGSQQLAHGLPQIPPQSSSLSSQGAQYFQSFGQPRDGTQSFAGSRGTFYRPSPPVDDEDEDLQYSSRDAWQNSNRKRKAP